MNAALAGRTVLVTGGARRVGAAICRRLHAAGAAVAVHHHRSATEAQALVQALNAQRARTAIALQADLLDAAALPRLVAAAQAWNGQLDALVNNASSFFATPVGTIDEQAWTDLMGTNLKAPLFLSQAAAPALRAAGGCIVNIIDIHAELPMKDHAVYTAAKGGLLALTRSLARELGPEVRVNGVSPGTIIWPEGGDWQDEDARRRIVGRTVLKRTGEPEDIAAAVEYMITAPFVTGQILAVDGGRSIVA